MDPDDHTGVRRWAQLTERYIRQLAVIIVDGRHGFTMEFSSNPEDHAKEYDEEEERLRVGMRGAPFSVGARVVHARTGKRGTVVVPLLDGSVGVRVDPVYRPPGVAPGPHRSLGLRPEGVFFLSPKSLRLVSQEAPS